MGSSVSRNINWRDEPATFQGADPEIFDKYIDEDRPVREMAATTKEMDMARLHRSQRDYCAHAYMQLFKCKRDWAPESWRCKQEVDALMACQHDELVFI